MVKYTLTIRSPMWHRLKHDGQGSRRGTVPYGASAKDCASTRQKRSLAWALLDSQPTVSSSSSPVRDPTLDKVQTTVPCHALFGPSQSVGEVTMMAWLAGWLDGWMDGWMDRRSKPR